MREDTFGKWSQEIIDHYRLNKNDTRPTTFSEFLEWWVDGTYRGSENEHWQTYRNLLNPCLYKWDYILKLENIEEESKWLFSEFNITEIDYPPGKVNVDSHLGHFLVSAILFTYKFNVKYCRKFNLVKAIKTQQMPNLCKKQFKQFQKICWSEF